MNITELEKFAARYATAWSGQEPVEFTSLSVHADF